MTCSSDPALNVLSGYIDTPHYNELPHVVKMAVQCCQRVVQELRLQLVTRADLPRVEIVSLFRQTNEFALLPTEVQSTIRNWLVQCLEWGKQVGPVNVGDPVYLPVFVEPPPLVTVTTPADRIGAMFDGQSVTVQEIPWGNGDLTEKTNQPEAKKLTEPSDAAIAASLRGFIGSDVFLALHPKERQQVEYWLLSLESDASDTIVDPKVCSVGMSSYTRVNRERTRDGDIFFDRSPCLCIDRNVGVEPFDLYVTVTHGIRFASEVPVEQKVAEAKASVVYEETGEQSSRV